MKKAPGIRSFLNGGIDMVFEMNGLRWNVIDVSPESEMLIDRNGYRTVATTDPKTRTIYLAGNLEGNFKKRVIAHEMGHAACFSYNLIKDIHKCCYPWKRMEMEEWICNFVADYGEMIFQITYKVIGDDAINHVPMHIERMIAR